MELIGQRWTGAIIGSLLSGNVRFSDIRASVPDLSDRLLWERLKALEAEGLVERMVVNRRHTAYRLTPMGEALKPVVNAIHTWAEQWLATGTGSGTRRSSRNPPG
jgi:DNA-binding HxlR family transcriptional regulator